MGPIIKSPPSNAGGTGLISDQGTTLPHAKRCEPPQKRERAQTFKRWMVAVCPRGMCSSLGLVEGGYMDRPWKGESSQLVPVG